MEDHGRTGILDDLAHGLVERRAARPAAGGRQVQPGLGGSTAPGFRARACAASSARGDMAEEIDVERRAGVRADVGDLARSVGAERRT